MTRIPIRRALVSVYDKAGLAELAKALHEAGAEIVSTGTTATDDRAGGHPRHQGRGPHRLPRVPRRPGQDPAPARARGPARGHDEPGPQPAAHRSRHRAVPAPGLQPVPVRADRGFRRGRRRDHRADRHRRPRDGPRRREEPRQRRGRDQPRPVRRPAQGHRRRRLHDGAAPPPRGPGLRAHRRLRRRGVLLVRRQLRPRRGRAGDRLAGPDRPGVDARRRAPLRREPAPEGGALQVKVNSRIIPNGFG